MFEWQNAIINVIGVLQSDVMNEFRDIGLDALDLSPETGEFVLSKDELEDPLLENLTAVANAVIDKIRTYS